MRMLGRQRHLRRLVFVALLVGVVVLTTQLPFLWSHEDVQASRRHSSCAFNLFYVLMNYVITYGRRSKIGYLDLSNMTYLSRLTMMFLGCDLATD